LRTAIPAQGIHRFNASGTAPPIPPMSPVWAVPGSKPGPASNPVLKPPPPPWRPDEPMEEERSRHLVAGFFVIVHATHALAHPAASE